MKLALVLGAGVLLFSVLMAELIWWWGPFAQYRGSFSGSFAFDFTGPVFPAALLLTLALGIFAGALTRRTVLAIFLTIALFLAIRLPVELVWRPYFVPPVTVTWPIEQATPLVTISEQDWIISRHVVDAQGNPGLAPKCDEDESYPHCVEASSARTIMVIYHPAERFWTFQWIETGIYVAFSALALLTTVWLVRRLA